MFKTIHKWYANLTGSNTKFTPTETIRDQMRELRPLPIGREEWKLFVDRIHSGHCIPGVTRESVEFALTNQVLALGPLEDFKDDGFFIHALRKSAVDQTVITIREEVRNETKARLAAQEAEKAQAGKVFELTKSEVTPQPQGATDETKDTSA